MSMAGLPDKRAMVWVGPPLSARPVSSPGSATPTWLPLVPLTRPPEPPVPIENGDSQAEVARLVKELESAEAYEVSLRQIIVDVRDQLAGGNAANALSMLNQALNYIDDATDVVTASPNSDGKPP